MSLDYYYYFQVFLPGRLSSHHHREGAQSERPTQPRPGNPSLHQGLPAPLSPRGRPILGHHEACVGRRRQASLWREFQLRSSAAEQIVCQNVASQCVECE